MSYYRADISKEYKITDPEWNHMVGIHDHTKPFVAKPIREKLREALNHLGLHLNSTMDQDITHVINTIKILKSLLGDELVQPFGEGTSVWTKEGLEEYIKELLDE